MMFLARDWIKLKQDKGYRKTKVHRDLKFPGMLHCKILRSPHAHAIVKSIDTSEAFKVDGVVDVITYEDVLRY